MKTRLRKTFKIKSLLKISTNYNKKRNIKMILLKYIL